MTYRQLIQQLQQLPDARLDDDVTVYIEDMDEYFASDATSTCNDGVLDDGHVFLKVALTHE